MYTFTRYAVLGVVGLGLLTPTAQAFGRRWCYQTDTPAPVAVAPAPAAPQVAATQQGYRSFSYQPAAQAPMTYQRTYRSNVNNSTAGGNGSAFHDAGWKTH